MKPPRTANPPPEIDETGLPVLRSWRGVYLFVLASFGLWMALLIWLTKVFS